MENVRRCLIAIVALGTKSWPETEERMTRRPDTLDIELQSSQRYAEVLPRRHRQTRTAIL